MKIKVELEHTQNFGMIDRLVFFYGLPNIWAEEAKFPSL